MESFNNTMMQTTKTSQQKKQTGTQALPYQKLFCTCVVKHKKFKISDITSPNLWKPKVKHNTWKFILALLLQGILFKPNKCDPVSSFDAPSKQS